MRKPKQLCCLDLRKHLCWEAQKTTSLCRDCKHPCDPGKEYRERFLFTTTTPTIASRNEARLKALVDAYVRQKSEKCLISAVLPMVKLYGIQTTDGLSRAWKRERLEMYQYAEAHGLDQYFVPRGRLSDEERSYFYAKRLRKYDAWLAQGLTWSEIGDLTDCSGTAAQKRYAAAKQFFEENPPEAEEPSGMFHY